MGAPRARRGYRAWRRPVSAARRVTPASPDGVASAVDTHCHLFLMEEEPEDVLRSAAEAGVERLICVGIDVESSKRSVELAGSFSG
ncbi:MAG TPA: TatD family hydrolase, partial [Actinomycetota bacterium]|nr:TatD family hydrolase [Actinomycetota bacterium]